MKCRQYSEAEKQSYVAEFKNSGQKINAFAKDNNIPVTTFSGWLKANVDVSFGKIQKNESNTPATSVPKTNRKTMIFASEDIRIELKENYSKKFLKEVVEVLINA